jgi:transposase
MSRLITSNTSQLFLFPSSFECWLPRDHQVRFFDEIIEGLELSEITGTLDLDQKRGRPAYDPKVMTKLVIYGYAEGITSARKLEKACLERIDFRFITGNRLPDYRSIARFKKLHLKSLAELHEQILLIAASEGLIEMKEVAIDGTKILANASKHKAMSYEHMCKKEGELKSEIKALRKLTHHGSRNKRKEIKEEIQFQVGRLRHIQKWKNALEERARNEGKDKPESKDQINFTDDESRIMKVEKQFEQAYNAQAAVDKRSQIILVAFLTQDRNDKQLLETMLDQVAETLGILPDFASADSGYFGEVQIERLKIKYNSTQLLVPPDRQHHGDRFISVRGPIPKDISTADLMRRKLRTKAGRQIYAGRKTTVEPVFGQIKEANLEFRQFSYRGLENAQNEWSLVCIAHNLVKIFRHRRAQRTELRRAA